MTFAGEFYHVLNRSNEKQTIFIEDENYQFFLKRLRKYVIQGKQNVIAYCLMPNHFHLLLKETEDDRLKETMQGLQTSYAKAINKRFQKTGHLFQDTYNKIRIESDEQLLHLTRYIHMNPVKAGLVTHPEEWLYSSYRDYTGLRKGTLPKPDIILSQFNSREAYRTFVEGIDDDKNLEGLTLD